MRTNLIVIDDFYTNPDQVRNFASDNFDVKGNYPGHRTRPHVTPATKQYIQDIVEFHKI